MDKVIKMLNEVVVPKAGMAISTGLIAYALYGGKKYGFDKATGLAVATGAFGFGTCLCSNMYFREVRK